MAADHEQVGVARRLEQGRRGQVAPAGGPGVRTRSDVESIRSIGWSSNRLLVAIAGLVVALQVAAIVTPLRGFLDLQPLGAGDVALCVALAAGLLGYLEVAKARRRSRLEA